MTTTTKAAWAIDLGETVIDENGEAFKIVALWDDGMGTTVWYVEGVEEPKMVPTRSRWSVAGA